MGILIIFLVDIFLPCSVFVKYQIALIHDGLRLFLLEFFLAKRGKLAEELKMDGYRTRWYHIP